MIFLWYLRCHAVLSRFSLWAHGLQRTRLLCPSDFVGKNTGVGCRAFLQGSSWPKNSGSSILTIPCSSELMNRSSILKKWFQLTFTGPFSSFPFLPSCSLNSSVSCFRSLSSSSFCTLSGCRLSLCFGREVGYGSWDGDVVQPLPGWGGHCDNPVGGGRGPGTFSCRWSFLQEGWFNGERRVSQLRKQKWTLHILS